MTIPASGATNGVNLGDQSSLTSAYGAAGDTINYDYLVSNGGTTTLTGIGVSDNLVASVNCPQSTLVPGGIETCTGTYHGRYPGRRQRRLGDQHGPPPPVPTRSVP